MPGTSLRSRLAADPGVGAGNVLTALAELDVGLDVAQLTFDTAVGGHPAGRAMTLRQLRRLVAARACAPHQLGIRKRDPVAACAPAAADTAVTFLALARLGAIGILINPALPAELAIRYIARLSAAGLITSATHAAELTKRATGAPLLSDFGGTTVIARGRQGVPGSVFADGLGSSEMGHSHFFIAHTPQASRSNRCIGKARSFAEVKVFGPDGGELPPGQARGWRRSGRGPGRRGTGAARRARGRDFTAGDRRRRRQETHDLDDPGPERDLDHVRHTARTKSIGSALSNGRNASLLFGPAQAAPSKGAS